jgi:hypothetical protein
MMARFSLTSKPDPLIVLLTDFGFRDSYVGVMKGVIRTVFRDADVVDLSHNIMPHDVPEAAFVLSASYRYFPEDTIFACVVDPGVGTDRAILCMRANDQTFLAPDNGLLSVIDDQVGHTQLRKVTNEEMFLSDASTTFHGRDIFAPVAAHLANGEDIESVGPPGRYVRKLQLPRPVRAPDGSLRGEIIYIDQFGNLITNIHRSTLEHSFSEEGIVEVQVKQRDVQGICQAYGDRPEGRMLALVGSSGYLEVAVNQGSAAKMLGCEKGDTVQLTEVAAESGRLLEGN